MTSIIDHFVLNFAINESKRTGQPHIYISDKIQTHMSVRKMINLLTLIISKTNFILLTSTICSLQNVIKKIIWGRNGQSARKNYKVKAEDTAKVNFLSSQFIGLFASLILVVHNRSSTFSCFSRGKWKMARLSIIYARRNICDCKNVERS